MGACLLLAVQERQAGLRQEHLQDYQLEGRRAQTRRGIQVEVAQKAFSISQNIQFVLFLLRLFFSVNKLYIFLS